MLLPYSLEVYFATMAAYNAAWWPAVALGLVLALAGMIAAFFPAQDNATDHWRRRDRFMAFALAAFWIWCGAVHQLGMMAEFDFMAPYYGAAMILQGGLFALLGLGLPRRRFRYFVMRELAQKGQRPGLVAGGFLAIAGIAIYPCLLFGSFQIQWQAMPFAGTAPDATAIVTAGLLLAMRPAPPLCLYIVPLAWAGVAAVSGYLLGFWPDFVVTVAVLVSFGCALRLRAAAR